MLHGNGCGSSALGQDGRSVRSGHILWILTDGKLFRIDPSTLQIVDVAAEAARDIAGDGTGGLWCLDENIIVHRDRRGLTIETLPLPRGLTADRIASAGDTVFALDIARGELAVLRCNAPVLRLYPGAVPGERGASFAASDLVSGSDMVLLTGFWGSAAGWLGCDAAGEVICSGVWDASPVCVTPSGDALLAAFAVGDRWVVRRFDAACAPAGELLLTPMLESDTLAGAWSRAQIMATLPEESTLDVTFAATGDAALASAAQAIFADKEQSAGDRVRKLRAILPWSEPLTYTGRQTDAAPVAEAFAAPVGDAAGNFLWLAIELHHNRAAARPAIAGLAVHHDVPGLMDFLPAVFRTAHGDGDGTLRRLVAVLEATFLGFDDEISKLADRVDPDRTEDRWLASLAALLGLPFDEALNPKQRRALLRGAAAIIAGRGTRAGVLALLTAVLGDRPYRVIDRTEQAVPIALGDGRLPGFLSGPSARVPRLDARLVLGRTPLDATGPCDGQVARAPSLLVVIPTRASERRRLGEALQQMIAAIVPAGVRLEMRWIGFGEATGGEVLGVVDNWPLMAPGTGLVPGAARLDGTHDVQLRSEGIGLSQRLD
ncbi:MAG: phage tail protein [Sandaracinobacter sp.]